MENITKNRCMSFAAGFNKISIAPVNEVESVDLANINTKKATLVTAGRFAEIEAENIQFGNSQSDGAYETIIQCDFRGNDPDTVHRFDAMTKNRFIVTIRDRNGVWWIQGDKNEPMRFEYSQITEPKAPGFSGFKLKFIRKTTLPLCKFQK